jgi:hypothetical protein
LAEREVLRVHGPDEIDGLVRVVLPVELSDTVAGVGLVIAEGVVRGG